MGAIIIGKMKIVLKIAMPRTGCSSASASAMPSTISALTQTAAKSRVVHSDDHTCSLLNAETRFAQPTHCALSHGVPISHL